MREKLPSRTLTVMLGATGALVVLLVSMAGSVFADQTVKTIEMPLGFNGITTPDQIVTYNYTIDAPDRIADVLSLEFVIKADLLANANVYGGVLFNGNPIWCDPAVWTVPPWNVDNYEIIFDCTPLLPEDFDWSSVKDTPITFAFMNDNFAGNVKPKVRMTYYNNPIGSLGVFGTEYEIDDRGTIFLQLKDSQGLPVNDGACYMDVYYPNQPNSTHDILLLNAPMLFLNNSDGLYYYDLTMPNVTGVYMISARCSYAMDSFWIYPTDSVDIVNRSVEVGMYSGDPWVLNDGSDYLYTKCASVVAGPKSCIANYTWDTSGYGINMSAVTNMHVHYLGETSTSDVTLSIYAWNWTGNTWYAFPNMLIFSGHATSGYPTGINDHLGNTYPSDITNYISPSGDIKVKLEALHGTNYDEYDNWLALNLNTIQGIIIEVKGSGELHVEDHFTNLTNFINGSFNNLTNLTAQEVWNYPNRNLTYINFSEVINRIDDLDVNLAGNFTEILGYLIQINSTVFITNGTVYDIWSFQTGELSNNLTEIQLYLADINDTAHDNYNWLTGMVNLSAYDVWNFNSKNLTYFNYTPIYDRLDQMNVTIHTKLDQMLANLSSVNSTLYQAIVDSNTSIIARMDAHNGTIMTKLYGLQTEISDMNTSLWGAIVDANASIISEITLTNSSLYQALVDSNTSIIGRLDAHNGTIMTELYAVRQDIQDLNVSNQDRYDVLNATIMNELYGMNDTLNQITQDINDTNSSILLRLDQHNGTIMTKLYLMQDEIASVNDSVVSLANLTAYEVWNYVTRNLTYYPDPVNYSLVQDYVWNATNRSLTELNFTVNINTTEILNAISATNSSLYQAIVDSNSSVLQAIIDANTSIIGRMDLHNNTIMLKLYSIQTDIANLNDLSASEVWSFGTRTLTDYNQTEIINLLKNINDTMYNLTIGNVTVSASVNWTEGKVVMNNITDPIIVEAELLTFAGRDQTPIQTITLSYCLDNSTLAYDVNTTRCWLDQCFTINETIPETCTYGCYQGACNPEPFDRITFLALIFLFVIVVIVLLALAYDRFVK